jgi:hypothetical protein
MNIGAKRAELMQLMHKFVPESLVGNFQNKRTRSTLLDRKVMFWGVLDCFVTTRTLVQNGHRSFSQRMHRIHPIGPQTHILGHLGPFHYCTNFRAKWVELVLLMHKFMQQSRVGIFCNGRTRSTTFDPKLMCLARFGMLCYYMNFGTKRAKLMQLMHKFVP